MLLTIVIVFADWLNWSIAVTWHRFVILNENPAPFGRNVAKSYYWRYCGKFFLILAVATAPLFIIFAFIAFDIDFEVPFDIDVAVPAVGSVILLAMHVIFVRLSLVLAAEATETVHLTWLQSLKLTRGNALRLVFGLFVCGYLPEFMIDILLECVGLVKTEMSSIEVLITTGESDVFVRHAVRHQTMAAVALMFFPIGIQFLSRSYQQLVPTIKTADVAR